MNPLPLRVVSSTDEAELRVKLITPASAAFGGKITVGVDGWEASDRALVSVRAQRLTEPVTTVVRVVVLLACLSLCVLSSRLSKYHACTGFEVCCV